MSYGPRPWIQLHWDVRAALNFIFGGTGCGFILFSAFVPLSPRLAQGALLLGLALVAAGLTAVWMEIGRKLRAAHVFFNPGTSWMTRESYAAVLVFSFGMAGIFFENSNLIFLGSLSALAFLWCQAQILRAAKGIPAWRAPQVVALIMTTALVEGTGLLMIINSDVLLTSLFTAAVIARAFAWSGYRAALTQPPSRAALESAGKALIQIGTIAPLALVFGGIFVPQAAVLAGIAAIITGWRLKFVLVTRAAFNQGFALPRLPVRGTR